MQIFGNDEANTHFANRRMKRKAKVQACTSGSMRIGNDFSGVDNKNRPINSISNLVKKMNRFKPS